MLEIQGTTIKLTRGDTMRLTIELTNASGNPITLESTDSIIFRLKKNAKTEELLIEKEGDPLMLLIALDEADTMDLAFGKYKYEIEVVYQNNHYTIVECAEFILGEELENHE